MTLFASRRGSSLRRSALDRLRGAFARIPSSMAGGSHGSGEQRRLRILSRIVEQVGDGVAVVDNEGYFVYVNPAFAVMHRGTVEALTKGHFSRFYAPEELQGPVQGLITAALRDSTGRAELTRLRCDGTSFPAQVTLSVLKDDAGELVGRVLSVQDITERKLLEQQLRKQAMNDPLTNLPNRRLLLDRIDHALALAQRRGGTLAVLFVDFDNFKVINDTYGHAMGDRLLVEFTRRVAACLRPPDTLARFGGDEFVVLMEDVPERGAVVQVAERILTALTKPFTLNGRRWDCSVSIGIATGTEGPAEQLLMAADAAMYGAKAKGKARYEFAELFPAAEEAEATEATEATEVTGPRNAPGTPSRPG